MMKCRLLVICCVIIFARTFGQNPKSIEKPAYAGVVEYAKGNFGGYNAPEKGDSVFVYTDFQKISFRIIGPGHKGGERTFWIDFKNLKLLKKKEYGNIVATNKTIPTGNYDMKFTDAAKNSGTVHIVSLTHYGDGSLADISMLGENDGHRLDDICVARVVRLK